MKTTPKIRHFSKSACRRWNTDLRCTSCGSEPEMICHVLFTGMRAKEAWETGEVPMPSQGLSPTYAFLILQYLVRCYANSNISKHIRQVIPWLLWYVWKAQKMMVFERTRINVEVLVTKAREEAEAWHSLLFPNSHETEAGPALTHLPITMVWDPPPISVTKCNVGCSWINKHQNCGSAWILRDSRGGTLFYSRRSYSHVTSVTEAEIMSIFWVVESIWNLYQSRVSFETSSRQEVEAIMSISGFPRYRPIVHEIRSHMSRLTSWELNYTPSQCNRPALAIAKSVTQDRRYQSYVSQCGSVWLQNILSEDASGARWESRFQRNFFSLAVI